MAKQQRGGDSTGKSLEDDALMIGGAIIILVVMAWLLLGPIISSVLGFLRRYEIVPFALFFPAADALRLKLVALDGRSLDFSNTVGMLRQTGPYVRWLYIPLFVWLAIRLMTKSTRGRFRRKHDMTSLAKQEAALWPEIAPVAGKQLAMVKGDLTKGEWAVALTEWEFAEKHKLATRAEPALKRDQARDVFVAQLGPRWNGSAALPKHARALYAAFLMYIGGEGKAGLAALRKMAKTFAAGGLKGMDTSFADAAIAKHETNPMAQRAIGQHAYVFTVLPTMLQLARAEGVLASPMFIWLKTVDRRLWYALNNVGRYAFHVECAGIAAHWLFEKTVSQACPSPMVEKAVDGLATALTEYAEDDSLDRLYK
ncbi:type IVB secretion system coupling complex protein DotM/IcmP [Methylibium petroleiphilum]|uniref:DotM C-terminal cytoplasmic domain-containing protein n=1 Tax=Methylibium petroleiphilum (strain ATCC BAA-1232 / LMG 22953 / PM1) TaxID=420662 RepID=A2SMP9_METPP|nr:type IVB secretion system coupling complex protein DotM/IcmP [Methylibium petroleiphilum]ABM96838.1 conserved hypothetical protein [Methylibium petroleiphilum PM1]